MRKGVWFKVLSGVERAIINLTIKCVERVHSTELTKIVVNIVNKIADASKSILKRLMHEIGPSLAHKLIKVAQDWGNKSATQWVEDSSFVQYLVVTHMNSLKTVQNMRVASFHAVT